MTLREYLKNPIHLNSARSLYFETNDRSLSVLRDWVDPKKATVCKDKIDQNYTAAIMKVFRTSTARVIVGPQTDFQPPDRLPETLEVFWHQNVVHEYHRVRHIPMGRDRRNRAFFAKQNSLPEKDILIYVNFSPNTHKSRKRVMKHFVHNPLDKVIRGTRFNNWVLNSADYSTDLMRSKFVVAPRGRGKDSFRFWDSLACGAIPIVSADSQPCWDLPHLILPQKLRRITKPYLNEQWEFMLDKEYNWDLLDRQYWIDAIENS